MIMDIEEFKKNKKTTFLAEEYLRIENEEESIKKMAEKDQSLFALAEEELKNLASQKEVVFNQMKDILTVENEEEKFPNEIVMEIRAGVGGEEAAIFALNLSKMYKRLSDLKGWQFSIVDESKTDLGGYKESSIEIKGVDVYKQLRFETGVHRVQRVPETEKSGRVHTSTASVAVLPIRKKTKVEINPTDLEIEISKAGGPGGQNVNKRETAVRIVHTPTNLSAQADGERSQAQNKEKALAILKGKIFKALEDKRIEKQENMYISKTTEVTWGNQIRSYVLHPYKMVKDHRTNVETSDVEGVLEDGKLDEFIEAEKSL